FACDTVWMARLARTGNLMRVPRILYHKRYLANGTHAEWATRNRWKKVGGWIQHCLDMLAEALSIATTMDERQLLIDAARERLCLNKNELGPYVKQIRALSSISRWAMRTAFETRAAMRTDIGSLRPAGQSGT